MKKTLSSLILLAVALSGFSQPRKYRKSMEKAIATVEQAVTPGDFTACATSFGEIAEGYPELWMPPYYAAYCLVTSTFESSDSTSKTETPKHAEAVQTDDPFWPRWGASQNQQQLNGLQ